MRGTNVRNASYQRCEQLGGQEGLQKADVEEPSGTREGIYRSSLDAREPQKPTIGDEGGGQEGVQKTQTSRAVGGEGEQRSLTRREPSPKRCCECSSSCLNLFENGI
eukprot:261102-Pyramimonas_sp.AAC.1